MTKIVEIRDYLNHRFFEREEIVEGLLVAAIARQHVVLIGPPGAAKSNVIEAFIECIDQASLFDYLFTKFTTPEEIFGPVSLKALEQDRYERIIAGKLPEANFAFLDEVFKASSAILNSLLKVMNERVYHNNGHKVNVPLHTMFGASNEFPQDENLMALFDRFLLRYEVPYLGEDGNFAKLLKGNLQPVQAPRITLGELEVFQSQAAQVPITDEVVDALVGIRRDMKKEGIEASDRRWKQSLSILQAKAIVEGRQFISVEDDLMILSHSLWNEPNQQKTVSAIVRKLCDPLSGRIDEIWDEAKDVARPAIDSQDTTKGAEANKKLKALIGELDGIIQKGGSSTRQQKANKVKGQVADLNKEVLAKCLGITV